MKVRFDENGYISDFATIGDLIDGTELEVPENLSHFENNFTAYRFKDGRLFFDEDKKATIEKEKTLKEYRRTRETECFSIINRGVLWYDSLTATQKKELKTWYEDWLDVTETLKVPTKPKWIT